MVGVICIRGMAVMAAMASGGGGLLSNSVMLGPTIVRGNID
jgi:hypothetical protein